MIVRSILLYGDREVAITLAAFGLGSMAAALSLPKLLDQLPDRKVMLFGAAAMSLPLLAAAIVLRRWETPWRPGMRFSSFWAMLGICYGMLITPTGRLLRRSAHEGDRPALFAAQFALSHACWLVTYPLAGWLGARVGLPAVMIIHAAIALAAVAVAFELWPAHDPDIVEHDHAELWPDHPHLSAHQPDEGKRHRHVYVIDELHRHWPLHGG